MEHQSLKNPSGHVGTRTCVASLSQQTCYALDHHASPKKDPSSTELSNTVFSHSSNVNFHIMTDAIFAMARWVFSMMFHDKILLYIYIYI